MTQINLDAARVSGQGDHEVTFSSGDFTLAGIVGVSIANTAGKAEVLEALRACRRAVSRQFGKMTAASSLPTSGSTRE